MKSNYLFPRAAVLATSCRAAVKNPLGFNMPLQIWVPKRVLFSIKISGSFSFSPFFFPSILGHDKNRKAEMGSSGLPIQNCSISTSKNAQGKKDGNSLAGYEVPRVLQKWCSHLKSWFRKQCVSSFDILPRMSASANLLKVTKVITDKQSGLFILERDPGITPLREARGGSFFTCCGIQQQGKVLHALRSND